MPTLLVRHPDGTVEAREVTGALTVGSEDGNDLVLRAQEIAGRHAQFRLEGDGLTVETVGTEEVRVDGVPILAAAKLKPETKVSIGAWEFTLGPVAAGPPEPPPRRRKLKAWKIAATFAFAGALAAVIWLKWPSAAHPAAPARPCDDVESMLRRARGGFDEKALEGATAALACDPMNSEALGLRRVIQAELDAEAQRRARRDASGVDLDAGSPSSDAGAEPSAGDR